MTSNSPTLKEWFIELFINLLSGELPWKKKIDLPVALVAMVSFLTVALALALWITALPRIEPRQMTDIGLPSVMPATIFVALLILVVTFGLLLRRSELPQPLLLLPVLALIVIIHATPALVYGTLRYSWAWKHIGIIDYIQRFGRVNPQIASLEAYHNWPGFFTLGTLFTEAAGLATPLAFANWAPVFFNLIDLGAVFLILSSLTRDRRLIWLAIWFFYLTNWVGQDYFAPQALSYFFHLVILGICLRWFSAITPPAEESLQRWLKLGWAAWLLHRLLKQIAPSGDPLEETRLRQRTALIMVMVVLFVVIAFSHQLTPFMTMASALALVIFLRINVPNLPILLGVITATWIIFGAIVFMSGEVGDLITSIGQVTDTIDSNLIDLGQASLGQRFVALTGRGLTVFLLGLAFLGSLRRLFNRKWDVSAALLIIVPFAILAVNSYGGEIIFRVYLFALPFLTFFAAALFYPDDRRGSSWWTTGLVIALSGVLLASFLFAYFGKDRQYYFTDQEIEAAEYLARVAPPHTLLIEGSRNYPSRFQNYEYFYYVAISREPPESRLRVVNDPVKVLTRWLNNDNYDATYLIISRGQKAEVDAIGELPRGSLDDIEQALSQSPNFQIVYQNEDATIFTLAADFKVSQP